MPKVTVQQVQALLEEYQLDQDSRLGSMGPIQKLMIKGQPVFLFCKGCEAEA